MGSAFLVRNDALRTLQPRLSAFGKDNCDDAKHGRDEGRGAPIGNDLAQSEDKPHHERHQCKEAEDRGGGEAGADALGGSGGVEGACLVLIDLSLGQQLAIVDQSANILNK